MAPSHDSISLQRIVPWASLLAFLLLTMPFHVDTLQGALTLLVPQSVWFPE